jgi:hypothetical protein
MVVSCETLRFSNADSFPSVQHFAVPPTFNTNEIYNGFLLQTEGLSVSLDGPTGYAASLPSSFCWRRSSGPDCCCWSQTQLLVSPVSGKFLFNKSFLGDLHSLLTQNKKPAKQFLISNSSPFTIKLTKPQIELIVCPSGTFFLQRTYEPPCCRKRWCSAESQVLPSTLPRRLILPVLSLSLSRRMSACLRPSQSRTTYT